jgi:hypothetical protein
LYNLLCVGVGTLGLVDCDVVEMSNLNRSILYNEDDVGTPKVEAARRAILRFAPRARVEAHHRTVTGPDELGPLIAGAGLVIGTADKPPWLIRHWIAEACYRAQVPFLQASGWKVGPLWIPGRPEASCSMCEWAALADRWPDLLERFRAQRRMPEVNPCGVSTVAAIASGIVATDALRFLTNHGELLTLGRQWELVSDLLGSYRELPRHPKCPVCGSGKLKPEDLTALPAADVAAPRHRSVSQQEVGSG